jgi:hypothetical protein
MPPITFEEAIRDSRLRTILHKYLVANGQEESYTFLATRGDNQNLYDTYVKQRAPRQINIPNSIRKEMDKLAGAAKWTAMEPYMKQARKSIVEMLDKDVMTRFDKSEEYLGYKRSLDTTPSGKIAKFLRLAPDKGELLQGLLKVYNDARTPVDKFKAYEALVKLAKREDLLRAAMRTASIPVPDLVRKGNPDKALKDFVTRTEVKDAKVKTALLTLLKKYNSSSLRSARATVEVEITKITSKHSVNGRELTGNILKAGGWTS